MRIHFIPSVSDLRVGSARLRAYLLARKLRAGPSAEVSVGPVLPRAAQLDILIIQKRYDLETVRAATHCIRRQIPFIVDICDNRLVSDKDPDSLSRMWFLLEHARCVVFSTEFLRSQFLQAAAERKLDFKKTVVIGDLSETYAEHFGFRGWFQLMSLKPALLSWLDRLFLPTGSYVLWFGNTHARDRTLGGGWDLARIAPEIVRAQSQGGRTLVVLTNLPTEIRRELRRLGVRVVARDWNYHTMAGYLRRSAGVVIPASNNAFAKSKTDNRLRTSLIYRKRVWFDKIPAYQPFEDLSVDAPVDLFLPDAASCLGLEPSNCLASGDDEQIVKSWLHCIAELTRSGRPELEMESLTACPCCQGTRISDYAGSRDMVFDPEGETFFYQRCDGCSAVFLNPRPPVETMGRYYSGNYAPYSVLGGAFVPSEPEKALLDRWLHPKSCKKVLDFGAGNDRFLRYCANAGKTTLFAFDFNQTLSGMFGSSGFDFSSSMAELEARAAQLGGFDYVRMSHVIEHIHDPRGLVFFLNSLLAPGGAVHVSTPNSRSLGLAVFRGFWRSIAAEAPRHVVLHSESSIASAAKGVLEVRESVSECLTKDSARSIGYFLEGMNLIRLSRVEALADSGFLARVLRPIARVAAARGRGDRFQVILTRVGRPCSG